MWRKRPIKLWLDDLRKPPDKSWTWVKTIHDAIPLIETGRVTHASLDNDLGDHTPEGRWLVYWMAEHEHWPSKSIAIHSANVPAAEWMEKMIERYGAPISPFKP